MFDLLGIEAVRVHEFAVLVFQAGRTRIGEYCTIKAMALLINRPTNYSMRNKLTTSLLAFFLFVAAPLFGQEILLNVVDSESITVEQIESAIAVIESRKGLDAETRDIVIEYLLEAQIQIQIRRSAEAATTTYAASLETAPEETAALRASLDEESLLPPTAESLGIDERTTPAQLEQRLAQETADLIAFESQLAELRAQVETELGRPAAIRDRIDQLRKSREELAGIINTQQNRDEQQIVANARKLSAQLARAAQGAEISKLEQELLSHAVRLSLLQAQRDVAARMQLQLGPRVDVLREAVNEQIQIAAVQAQQTADAAELALADKHPLLRRLAEDNAGLTRKLPLRAAATQELGRQLERTQNEVSDIEQRLARSEQQLEIGGLNRVLGSILIAERRSLPPLAHYRADIRKRNRDASTVGLERIRVQEQRRELVSIDRRVRELMVDIADDFDDDPDLAANDSEIRELLLTRRDLLVQLENSYGSYLRILGNLDIEQRHLHDSTDRYQQFLAQNLLWIPSAQILGMGVARDGLPTYPQALSLDAWSGVATQLAESIGQHVDAGLFCLAILILLLLIRKPLSRQYTSMSEKVGRLSTDSIVLTIVSLGIIAVRVLPIPFLTLSVIWFLNNASQPTALSVAAAQSMAVITPFIYDVLLFAALSAPGGMLNLHFGWSQNNTDIIRRQLQRLTFIGAPLLFFTAILFFSDIQSDRATVGRLVFIALMVFLSIVIRPILHPDSGAVASYYQRYAGSWSAKLRWVWFGIGVGLPLLLAVVSSLGFLYTSTTLAGLLVGTFWRGLGLVILYLVVLRWLALARRKLALQLVLKDRETRRAEKQNAAESEDNTDAAPVAEAPLDLDEVDQQTKKLLRSVTIIVAAIVAWKIWADVLPAFSFLSEVDLWTRVVTIDSVDTLLPVTLADVFLAILIIAVTVITAKNLPGLMEILILQRLTLAPGSRYAINTLVRYFVVTIGTFSVLGQIGWDWGQIQWLVAALSVGLGFGLQEIVANFVSGLIILFERPVRVGDTVTVGELTGTVSRVRIRATTITDWDRKEILVPNKSFITGQVINWTLSDPITRIVIPVGVSYGSDAVLTQKVMSDTLISLPLVLDEPPPKVYFTGFGDSSLNFTLHAYLRQLSDRLPLVHEVHEAILKALRENGIEIPFPQRDVHIRSTVEDS